MRHLLRFAFAVAIAIPLTCQSDSPYFSLTSTRTFGTDEEPSVQLTGIGVGAVQMRVYQIKDPVSFFSSLDDAHSFGGTTPKPLKKRTWLESLHEWKRELRKTIRTDLRQQFSESPSAHLLTKPASEATFTPHSQEVYFAQAPVLNQEQLVLSFVQPVESVRRWDSKPVPIRVHNKGVYLVEAVTGNLRAYTILAVSDVVIITKVGKTGLLTYVANRKTGQPIGGATISQFSKHSERVTKQSDADGLAQMPIVAASPETIRLITAQGNDYAFNDLDTYSRSSSGLWTGYIYTDRPVYRPGDTVHFRGILRKQAAIGYETPVSSSVDVVVSDPEGKPVFQKTLTSNANGIIHDEIPTEKTAALGSFYIQVVAAGTTMTGSFEIQEYKKPEYEVHISPDKTRVLEGENIKAVIDSKYYFGEPVAGAKVEYSVHRSRYWFPYWSEPGEESESEGSEGDSTDDGPAGEELSKGEGTLDADGKLSITVPTEISESHTDYTYRIEAGVTDKAGREISGTGYVTATYGAFMVSVEPINYFAKPGSLTALKVLARDYENNPISTSVHLEMGTWNFRSHKEEGAVTKSEVITGADGTALTEVMVPRSGGEIRVTASARAGVRTVEAYTFVWAPYENYDWGFSNTRSLKIVADQKTYKKGDKAKILVLAGQPGAAILVTVEGRDLRSSQVLKATGGTAEFDYQITADDQPGFFVSAEYIRDGALYQGQKRISVPPVDHCLNVTIATDKPTYLPGQTADYDIQVSGADGKPAVNADLSLGVVDEAIYAIRHDQTPNILSFFYGKEYDSVLTQSSLDYYFNGEAGTRRMRLAQLRSTSKLAQLKPEQLIKPKIRKVFPDTAFWVSDLTTDASGHAKTRVTFPDSLTTWRSTVRGVAPGDEFGSQTAKVIVRKNLILRLAVPRFFVQGDEVVISAIVHNYLTYSKKVKVSLSLTGLENVRADANQDVEIPSRQESRIDWRVKASQLANAKITGEALTNEESDALELIIPIHPPGVPLHEGHSGSISNSGNQTIATSFPGTAIAGSRSISVRLSSSVAGSIFSALEYLTAFPYGCVEQTMSSFLPNIMVQKSIHELGLKQQVDEAALQEKIQAGLDRLYKFQHSDGGWGWWETDETHPFMTAYVVAGMSEARANGVAVDDQAIKRGLDWLNRAVHGTANGTDLSERPDLRAYMSYAMAIAGKPDQSATDQIFADRRQLSPYGLALLGLTLQQTKDKRTSELAENLGKQATDDGAEVSWPAKRDQMLDFEADITPESTAYVMKFLSHEIPSSPLLPKAALWLVNHRNEGYWWSSTKQTAMVIYGLIDYLKSTNELHPNLSTVVMVNGQKIAEQTFNSDSALAAPEILLDESKLHIDANKIRVESSGSGRLYYSVTSSYNSNDSRLEKNGAVSLNLLRDYFQLQPEKVNGRIVYNLKELQGPVTPGDVIAVRLTVTGSHWRYLLLEDPIPAGTEFIEKDNLYEINNKPPWWRYWFSRRELHDDRLAIFERFFDEQQKQYFYLLKVVNAGNFHVSPARVQPMYQPGHEATTEGRMFEVVK